MEKVLGREDGLENNPETVEERRNGLRVVESTTREHLQVDERLKTLLDDISDRRQYKKRERLEMESDPPDAA